jgi:hypothetical protein
MIRGGPARKPAPGIARSRPSQAYTDAIDRAAVLLLAALRDHAKPQFSAVQLEAMRLRGRPIESAGSSRPDGVHEVFTDLRERAMAMLTAELNKARVADDVAMEMIRILRRLLDSVEQMFADRR